jgi:hypothetical protein
MATEMMTSGDLAAAELLVCGSSRISITFSRIADAAKEALFETAATRPRFHYNADGGAIEGWVTLRDPANWHIGWGIRFPSESNWWTKTELPKITHAFVYLYSESAARHPVARLTDAQLGKLGQPSPTTSWSPRSICMSSLLIRNSARVT